MSFTKSYSDDGKSNQLIKHDIQIYNNFKKQLDQLLEKFASSQNAANASILAPEIEKCFNEVSSNIKALESSHFGAAQCRHFIESFTKLKNILKKTNDTNLNNCVLQMEKTMLVVPMAAQKRKRPIIPPSEACLKH